MRLGSTGSGLGSTLDEPKEVSGQFCKDAEQLIDRRRVSDEPTGQTTLEVSENVGAVDAIVLSCLDVEVLLGGTEYGKGVEVVAEHFGTESCCAASQEIPESCSRLRRCLIRLKASSIRHLLWYRSAKS